MTDNSGKTLISQRWNQKFQVKVKNTATKLGMSMTSLTIEAISLYIELAEMKIFQSMKPKQRKNLLLKSFKDAVSTSLEIDDFYNNLSLEGIETIGLIKDQVEELLKNNPQKKFSTNEISNILNIPQSTARTYVRELGNNKSDDFILVRGRPNRIYFEPI